MSIIIRDMEMPKDGDVLMVRKDDDGKIYIKGSHTWGYSAELIELPEEYGDLIDRDELRKKKWAITWDEGKAECKAEYYNAEDIEAAPAVIPAEVRTE